MNGKRIVERKKEGRQGERGGRNLRRTKKGGEKKKCKLRAKRGREKKKEEKKKKSSPQNRTRVPLMNRHNDRSCANLG